MKKSGHFTMFCATGDIKRPHLALLKEIEGRIRDLEQVLFQNNGHVSVFSGDWPLPAG
jgi:hypothetical protein